METWSWVRPGQGVASLAELEVPILVDIYSEPIISELANVYNIDKPIISIPRVKIKSTIQSYDGSSETSTYIPTATSLVRASQETINCSPNTNTNVFNEIGVDASEFKMNRRYTMLTKLTVSETGTPDAPHTHELTVNLRPDNRNQISRNIDFTDSTGTTATAQITGHVDYEKGLFNYSVIYSGGDGDASFSTDSAVLTVRLLPYATMKGRAKVSIETEQTDVTIDPNEDFGIKVLNKPR